MKKHLKIFFIIIFFFNPFIFAASPPPVVSQNAMVNTAHYLASKVGLDILKEGGNAIDAAVAIGYALAVVHPCCGNLGGGGFMLIHLQNGKNIFLNFREVAPLAIKPELFMEKGKVIADLSRRGYLAVGVPGTVMGLNEALKKYGTMSLEKVIAPAIQLARQGFIVNDADLKFIRVNEKIFSEQPNIKKNFFKNEKLLQAGDYLVQPELANTLQLIAKNGSAAFYQGEIGEQIIAASEKNHGVLTQKDFQNYHVEELKPLVCQYRGYQIVTAPPPSSGGITICEILNIVSGYPLKDLGPLSAQSIHYNVEAMRYAFADRNYYLGDPEFITIPTEKLLSEKHAAYIRSQILVDKAGNSRAIKPGFGEGNHTTSFAVADKFGNVVSTTYTLNSYFGAKVIAGNTGIFLNNEMDDFAIQTNTPDQYGLIYGSANLVAPGRHPLSSMSPTIVMKDEKPFLALGAAGGPTIITQVLLQIENVIDFGMDISLAINFPRYHMQWFPDQIYFEPFAISSDTQNVLAKMGYVWQYGFFERDQNWGQSAGLLFDANQHLIYAGEDVRYPNQRALGN